MRSLAVPASLAGAVGDCVRGCEQIVSLTQWLLEDPGDGSLGSWTWTLEGVVATLCFRIDVKFRQ